MNIENFAHWISKPACLVYRLRSVGPGYVSCTFRVFHYDGPIKYGMETKALIDEGLAMNVACLSSIHTENGSLP